MKYQRPDGRATYGDSERELADLADSDKFIDFNRSRLDGLSFAGSGAGHQFRGMFWGTVAALVITGSAVKFLAGSQLKKAEDDNTNLGNGYASRFDLEARDDVIQSAKISEELLIVLSKPSSYLRDDKSRKIFLSQPAAMQLQSMLGDLQTYWPAYSNNQSIKLLQKLIPSSDGTIPPLGLTKGEVLKAYEIFAKRQEKRVRWLQSPPFVDEDMMALSIKTPKIPNLDTLAVLPTESKSIMPYAETPKASLTAQPDSHSEN